MGRRERKKEKRVAVKNEARLEMKTYESRGEKKVC